MDRGASWATVYGVAESDTIVQLTLFISLSPMDRSHQGRALGTGSQPTSSTATSSSGAQQIRLTSYSGLNQPSAAMGTRQPYGKSLKGKKRSN